MKSNKKIACLCVLWICFIAKSYAQRSFVLTGKIPASASQIISLQVDKNHMKQKMTKYNSDIKNGTFNFNVALDRDYVVELLYPGFRFPIYAAPGDSIFFDYSDQSSAKVSLSGKGAIENTFLQSFFTKFQSDFDDSVSEKLALTTTIDAFEAKLFSQKKMLVDYFKADASYTKFNEDFKLFISNSITFNYWRQLYSFPIVNANSSQQIMKVTPLPDLMLADFSKVKYDDAKALASESYLSFLKYYITYETSKANGFNKFTDLSISADRKSAVAKEKLSGEVLAYWLTKYVTDECGRISPFMTNKIYESIKEFDKDKSYQQIVLDVCGAKMKESGKSADPSKPTTQSVENNSNELDLTTLEGKPFSLSSLKGKVVYIDFWASWCGPCRGMMPFSKQLHDNLSEKEKKNIIFLYISIDANQDAWKKGITDMGMEGVQVISPGNWSSKVCAYYQINSIPRYMIMGKSGEIVDFNAVRPNDPALLDKLRELSK